VVPIGAEDRIGSEEIVIWLKCRGSRLLEPREKPGTHIFCGAYKNQFKGEETSATRLNCTSPANRRTRVFTHRSEMASTRLTEVLSG